LPRDLSVNEPRRPFCPSCKTDPVAAESAVHSGFLLANVQHRRIGFRYLAVELLKPFFSRGLFAFRGRSRLFTGFSFRPGRHVHRF
jgi:hypothetical protein